MTFSRKSVLSVSSLSPRQGGFQGLEIRMVQNAVHEGAEAAVDIRDHAVDHALVDLFVRVDGA